MADIYDKGTAVRVEITVREAVAFGDDRLYDPSVAPTVTVTDPDGSAKVTAAAMIKTSRGRYYYDIQTLAAWAAGLYEVKFSAGNGTLTAVKKQINAFELR